MTKNSVILLTIWYILLYQLLQLVRAVPGAACERAGGEGALQPGHCTVVYCTVLYCTEQVRARYSPDRMVTELRARLDQDQASEAANIKVSSDYCNRSHFCFFIGDSFHA